MEIKSSLLNNDDDLKYTKESIIAVSQIDHKEDFRVDLVEYINDVCDNDDDTFFYNMMRSLLFLNPYVDQQYADSIAFTTPEKLIYLNSPGNHVGENVREWEFIYCHECLHQLWDTFDVGKRIKEAGIEYNHTLLNIVSDCVINQYLRDIRKKEPFKDGIFPEYIKEKFDIEYNPKVDTQYTLYLKCLEKKNEMLNDPFLKDNTEFDDKIKAPINQDGGTGGGGESPFPPVKHSDEYKKGWRDGIKDVLDKKVDPTTYTPKKAKDDYDKGYNDVIDEIKNGLEDGVTLSKVKSGGDNKNGNDLADIPWDIPPQGGSGGKKSDKNNDDKSDSPSDSDIDDMDADEAADTAKDMADKAQDAANKAKAKAKSSGSDSDKADADKAQDAADAAADAAKEAQDAAEKGDTKGAQNAAKDARDAKDKAESAAGYGDDISDDDIDKMSGDKAADVAKDMADKAQDAADKAKAKAASSGKDSDKADADKAQQFADEAEEAAKEAEQAAKKGKDKDAKEAAKRAKDAKEAAEDITNRETKEGSPGDAKNSSGMKDRGSNKGNSLTINIPQKDLEEITRNAQKEIEKYKNKISGDFGKFISKCQSSIKLQESGLAVKAPKALNGWNTKLETQVNAFVKQKIYEKKRMFKSTYSRVKRGSGFIRYGQPITPGKKRRDENLTINVAIYIDRSGSMAGCIDDVFKACYIICDALKKNYARDQVVEDITFKIFAFDMEMHPLRYGQKMGADGGTMEFDSLFKYIKTNTADHLINIIITDAESSTDENVVNDILKDHEGLIVFITNGNEPTIEKLSKVNKNKNKLVYITASADFKID